jgi:DNA repair protein RecO (recombination protein O)
MREINDEAVVLRTYKSGEADRVVVLWTRHHGKVRVLAKGVRKTTSRMGGSLETLAHVEVDLVKTRGEFYVARHVQHRERLSTLRSSYARISAGYAVVEAIDAIPSDGVPDEAVVNECVNCGRTSPLVAFDAQIGGTLCDECRQGVALSRDALVLIRRMVGGDLAGVLREANPPGAGEVMAIAQEAIEVHFGRRLRAPGSVAPLIAPSEP